METAELTKDSSASAETPILEGIERGSRADRLLHIIEGGNSSTAGIMLMAARQLGEHVRLSIRKGVLGHIQEATDIVNRALKALLANKIWEVRQAACNALVSVLECLLSRNLNKHHNSEQSERICDKSLSNFTPEILKDETSPDHNYSNTFNLKSKDYSVSSTSQNISTKSGESVSHHNSGAKRLKTDSLLISIEFVQKFNVMTATKDYMALVSSLGNEFEVDMSAMSSVENQRLQLKKTLDLMDGQDEFTAMLLNNESTPPDQPTKLKEEMMSSRERAMERRKFKSTNVSDVKSSNVLKLDLDFDSILPAEADIEIETVTWKRVILALRSNLLNANWTVRHGSVLGLKALLKDSFRALIVLKNQELYASLSCVIIRDLVALLALDRFADFVGDSVCAPVRETAAQLLSIIAIHSSKVVCDLIWSFIRTLSDHYLWQVRHGGLLAVKYLVALGIYHESSLEVIRSICINACLDEDEDDDVCSLALECLQLIISSTGLKSEKCHQEADKKYHTVYDSKLIADESVVNIVRTKLTQSEEFSSASVLSRALNLFLCIKIPESPIFMDKLCFASVVKAFRHPLSVVRLKCAEAISCFTNLTLDDRTLIVRLAAQAIILDDNVGVIEAYCHVLHQFATEMILYQSSLAAIVSISSIVLQGTYDSKYFVFPTGNVTDHVLETTDKHAPHEIGFKAADQMIERDPQIKPLSRRLLAYNMQPIVSKLSKEMLTKIAATLCSKIRANDTCHLAIATWLFGQNFNVDSGLIQDLIENVSTENACDLENLWNWRLLTSQIIQNPNTEKIEKKLCFLLKHAAIEPVYPILMDISDTLVNLFKVSDLNVYLSQDFSSPNLTRVLRRLFAVKEIQFDDLPLDISLYEKLHSQILLEKQPSRKVLESTFVQAIKDDSVDPRLLTKVLLCVAGVPRDDDLPRSSESLSFPRHGDALKQSLNCPREKLDLVINLLVSSVFPLLEKHVDLRSRTMEVILNFYKTGQPSFLTSECPLAPLLILPVLRRISDQNVTVRTPALHLFSLLLPALPLYNYALVSEIEGEAQSLLLEAKAFIDGFIGCNYSCQNSTDTTNFNENRNDRDGSNLNLPEPEIFSNGLIKVELRPYQRVGVAWLHLLHRYGLNGALCDDMGLGKTLQTICMLASAHHSQLSSIENCENSSVKKYPSMVVCPASLLGHWEYEIKKYAIFLPTVILSGNSTERRRIILSFQDKASKINYQEYAPIMIASYESVRADSEALQRIRWEYIVLDEGHMISNPNSKLTICIKALVSEHRLLLSGTPIQNSVREVWSLFDFLMPGLLGTHAIFHERYGKAISAVTPSLKSNSTTKNGSQRLSVDSKAYALADEKTKELNKQILPFLLRRMKEDVLQDLPPKTIQDVEICLTPPQRILYDCLASTFRIDASSSFSDAENSVEKSNFSGDKKNFLTSIRALIRVSIDPATVYNEWRGKVQFEGLEAALSQIDCNIDDIACSAKLGALRDLLVECGILSLKGIESSVLEDQSELESNTEGRKVLIFAQLKSSLDIVSSKLLNDIPHYRIDGGVEGRARFDVAQRFNASRTHRILLLTTSVGGLGLNLTAADTVIFLEHDWNPMRDLQAMDRAHRIGQLKQVLVYRLIGRDTVEQHVMGLQRWKTRIASTVVRQQDETAAGGSKKSSGADMLDLFLSTPHAATTSESSACDKDDEYGQEFDLDDFVKSL